MKNSHKSVVGAVLVAIAGMVQVPANAGALGALLNAGETVLTSVADGAAASVSDASNRFASEGGNTVGGGFKVDTRNRIGGKAEVGYYSTFKQGSVSARNSTVDGNVEIKSNNAIDGNVTVEYGSALRQGSVEVNDSKIGGNLKVNTRNRINGNATVQWLSSAKQGSVEFNKSTVGGNVDIKTDNAVGELKVAYLSTFEQGNVAW